MNITSFDINPLVSLDLKSTGTQKNSGDPGKTTVEPQASPLVSLDLKSTGTQKNSGDPGKTIVKPQASSQETDLNKLHSAANSIKEYMNSLGVKLNFQFQEDSDRLQVVVVDPENDKVIRKIPSDELLSLAESIEDMLGVLVNKKF
ncbi:flagellar protein FlaG [Desulfonatronospira sp.]|uniref:flagellar protein FlaG n=1 Tax=Desulfonatronospira sp. TaxID=1962951 RepID=UPI0025C2DCE4|nr:flagellar protein FlaG [Desulfonatronospira sp.]